MRKIETEMLNALKNGLNWSKDNTQVKQVAMSPRAEVFLHGHKIADCFYGCALVEPSLSTLRAWPTMTTKSRLRALGVNVTTRKGDTFVDGVKL